jgi:hypothetical protein
MGGYLRLKNQILAMRHSTKSNLIIEYFRESEYEEQTIKQLHADLGPPAAQIC